MQELKCFFFLLFICLVLILLLVQLQELEGDRGKFLHLGTFHNYYPETRDSLNTMPTTGPDSGPSSMNRPSPTSSSDLVLQLTHLVPSI